MENNELTSAETITNNANNSGNISNNCCNSDFDEFAPSYADLPMEIIIKIFRYLNFTDIQSVSLTCHRWLEATQHKEFQSKILLNFKNITLSDNQEPIKIFLYNFRKFINLQLSQIEFDIIDKFFLYNGYNIEELILDTIDISVKEFILIITKLKNLKILKIIKCSSLFMAGQFFDTVPEQNKINLINIFENIRELSLKNNQYLSDMILIRITSLIKNLEILDMSGCHIAYHNMIQRRFYPIIHYNSMASAAAAVAVAAVSAASMSASSSTSSTSSSSSTPPPPPPLSSSSSSSSSATAAAAVAAGSQSSDGQPFVQSPSSLLPPPSESILTFKYLLFVIKNHVKTLKEIDLSSTFINGQALISLSELNELNLLKLNLSYCRQLNYVGFQNLFSKQTNLKYLDVSYSLHITDQCMDIITDNLSLLDTLKLKKCIKLTDYSIIKLKKLKYLRVLDISHCDSITSDGIINGIAEQKNYTLIELYLSSIDFCELCIIRCSENLPNLIVFDIGCCVNGVTDTAVQSIVKNLIWLRVLNLEGCSLITDAAITGIDIKKELSANDNLSCNNKDINNKDDNNYCSECSSSYDITCGSNDSSNNIRISLRSKAEEDIYQDAQRKKAILAIFEMNHCVNNDDKIIQDGLTIKNHLKGLQTLNLRSCNKISDISLKYGISLLELRKLCLSNCQQISYIGIDALVKNCPSIEDIDISECHNINDKAVESITKYLKRLKSLNISGCTQLTDYSLDYIVLNCKVLQNLSAYRCRRICSDIDLRLSTLTSLRIINKEAGSNIENVDIYRMKAPVPPWNY